MKLKIIAIILLLSLLFIFGFKKTFANKNKEQSTSIEQLNILKYLPEDNKLLFISNLDIANIVSTETTSSQIGSTLDLTAEVIISQSQAHFVVYGNNPSYKVKTIIKAI